MSAHRDLRETPETRMPYGQAAKFHIKAIRRNIENEALFREELYKVKDNLSALTTTLECSLEDVKSRRTG